MTISLISLWKRAVDEYQPVQVAPRLFISAHGARHNDAVTTLHICASPRTDEDRADWQRWVHASIPSSPYKRRLQATATWLFSANRFHPEQLLVVNVGPPWPHDVAALFGYAACSQYTIQVLPHPPGRCAQLQSHTGRPPPAPPCSPSTPSSTSARPSIAGSSPGPTTWLSCTRRAAAARQGSLPTSYWLHTTSSAGGTTKPLHCSDSSPSQSGEVPRRTCVPCVR